MKISDFAAGPVVLVEWTFSPPDFFETQIAIARADYTMAIDAGLARARIEPSVFDARADMRAELDAALRNRFEAQQVVRHKPYDLGSAAVKRVGADGAVNTVLFGEMIEVLAASDSADCVLANAEGVVLKDTKAERIAANNAFAERVEAHASDALLRALLVSYRASVRDPNDELVHLYEIREALSKQFGGETTARATLGVSKHEWSELGRISNSLPVRQGRHRGQSPGVLRDATEEELTTARRAAFEMIQRYLDHLAGSAAQNPSEPA